MLLDSNILVTDTVNTIRTSKQAASEIIYSHFEYFRKLWIPYVETNKKNLKELF